MIRLLIADDHAIMREGLARLLEGQANLQVAATASDGHETIEKVRSGDFDMVLLDLSMPGRSGIELIKLIKTEFPHLPILILSMHKEEQYALRALKAGAAGYLTKESASQELVMAIHKVASGEIYLTAEIARAIALDRVRPRTGSAFGLLSDREFNVMLMIGHGKPLNEIALELNLSAKTVSTYKNRIMEKLRVSSNAELIRSLVENNLLDDRSRPSGDRPGTDAD